MDTSPITLNFIKILKFQNFFLLAICNCLFEYELNPVETIDNRNVFFCKTKQNKRVSK